MARIAFRSDLPESLAVLAEFALDLRWTWSHAGDDLWRMIDSEVWERTRNPWTLLQDVSRELCGGTHVRSTAEIGDALATRVAGGTASS